MKTKFIIIIISYFFISSLIGQKIMPALLSSSGGLHSGQNVSLGWTLGEISIKTIKSDDIILTQGFQQSHLYTVSTLNPEKIFRATVYPNPAKDIININIEYPESILYTVSIVDINGNIYRRIPVKKLKGLDISGLKQGYYFIVINSNKGIELTGIKFLKLK